MSHFEACIQNCYTVTFAIFYLTEAEDIKKRWRPETIKLLEDNIGKTLSDIHHSRILYDPPPRILEIKAKINKWDLINLPIVFYHPGNKAELSSLLWAQQCEL